MNQVRRRQFLITAGLTGYRVVHAGVRPIDEGKWLNVMWYVGKFDEATSQFFNALGLTPNYLRDESRGMAAVDQHISYLQELHAGDVVTVRTTILEVNEKSLRFTHKVVHDETNAVVARTTLKAVHMDTVARKSCTFAEHVTAKARSLVGAA